MHATGSELLSTLHCCAIPSIICCLLSIPYRETPRFTPERIEVLRVLSKKPDVYERLARAIAPSIYENEDIKKGILLQLFGGTRKDFKETGRGSFRWVGSLVYLSKTLS